MSRASVGAPFTMQNAAVANGNGVAMAVDGYSTLLVSVRSSVAMSGGTTVNFEASSDNSNWVAIVGTSVAASPATSSTSTADGDFRFDVTAYRKFRARISAYSAGTTTITGHGTSLSGGGTTSVTATAVTSTEKRPTTATLTQVSDQATHVTILASNAARLGARVVNDSTAILYIAYGTTATTSVFTHKLNPGETLFEDEYTGLLDGIWSADASGAARVTELTA